MSRLFRSGRLLIGAAFAAWGIAYIVHASFIAMDGHRYFSLVDDAMISMRYAWNLAHGEGLVWNPGERVEGYSNLLMVLWMSAATLLLHRSGAALLVQLGGIPLLLGTGVLASEAAEEVRSIEGYEKSAGLKILVFAATLLYYPLAYWTLLGMEAGLLAALVTGAALGALRFLMTNQPARLYLVAVALGFAFLTRNDSSVYTVILFAYVAVRLRGTGAELRTWYLAVCTYLLFVAGQEAFRYLYYGAWLPNTYLLKLTGMPLLERLRNGIGFVIPFLKESSLLLVLAGIGLFVQRRHPKFFLGSLAFSAVAYQVYVGGDPWDRWRMLSPLMPLTLTLCAAGAAGLAQAITRGTVASHARLATAVFVLLGLLGTDLRFMPEILLLPSTTSRLTDIQMVNQAIALDAVTTRAASIGVIYAGTVPYFTGRRAIDFLGKSDEHIASLPPDLSGSVSWSGMTSVPGHNKYDLNYSIKQLRPTYVQTLEWGSQDIIAWSADYYVKAFYKSVSLCLLKNSPEVRWQRVEVVGSCRP